MEEPAQAGARRRRRNHNNEQLCVDATKLSHRSSLPKIRSAGGRGKQRIYIVRERGAEKETARQGAGLKEKCC